MKLVDNKKLTFIIISAIAGLGFGAYIIYEQLGEIGTIGLISLSFTALIAFLIIFVVLKIANKE